MLKHIKFHEGCLLDSLFNYIEMGLKSNFWILSFSMLFFMISFNLIMPQLNDFISQLGGANYKGLLITFFTIAAAVSRPFSGKLADTIGRKKVVIIGYFLAVLVGILYLSVNTIFFFLLLRFIHGFAVGFAPTGATALVTDIIPYEIRGKGMGIWGMFVSLGIGIGQFFGTPLFSLIGNNGVFMVATFCVIISLLLMKYVQDTLPIKKTFQVNHLRIKKADVIDINVLPSAIVMFLTAMCSGVVFVLTPDVSEFLQIENKGWFFFFYVLTTMFVRLFAGNISDKYGRKSVLLVGVILLTISMYLMTQVNNIVMYTISSIIFGLATGINSPALFAWTADLSHQDRRGVGAGTLFIALECGIMLSSFLTLFFYKNNIETVFKSFFIGAIPATFALFYLVYQLRNKD
jgi:MFS family permease